MNMIEPISIALADDNYIYRVGFKRELKKFDANIKLLFEAENGEEFIDKLKEMDPVGTFRSLQSERLSIHAWKRIFYLLERIQM